VSYISYLLTSIVVLIVEYYKLVYQYLLFTYINSCTNGYILYTWILQIGTSIFIKFTYINSSTNGYILCTWILQICTRALVEFFSYCVCNKLEKKLSLNMLLIARVIFLLLLCLYISYLLTSIVVLMVEYYKLVHQYLLFTYVNSCTNGYILCTWILQIGTSIVVLYFVYMNITNWY